MEHGVDSTQCVSVSGWIFTVCDFYCFHTEIAACSDVALTINGDIVYTDGSTDNRPVGTVATYTCNTGYTPTGGSLFRFCMTGGKWSESAPTCQGEFCNSYTFFFKQL